MPLLGSFRTPFPAEMIWPSFLAAWCLQITGWLNRRLPRQDYRANLDVITGWLEAPNREADSLPPSVAVSAELLDWYLVLVTAPDVSPQPAAVVTFVSPGIKANPNRRAAFVRCLAAYLHRGTSVLLVDPIAELAGNLHNELLQALGGSAPFLPNASTYAVSYRPICRRGGGEIDVWPYPAAVGQPIPAVPLGLRGGPTILLDLEGTYMAAIEATGL